MTQTIKERGLEIGSLVVFDPDSLKGGYRDFIEEIAKKHQAEYPLQIFAIDWNTGWITSLKGKSGRAIYASSPGKSHTNFDPRCLKLWKPKEAKHTKKWWQKLLDRFWNAFSVPY